MATKKKQQLLGEDNFIPDTQNEENTPDYNDPEYWAKLASSDTATASEKAKNEAQAQQKKIESLYPRFKHRRILLDDLVPAKDAWNFFPEQNAEAQRELMKNIVSYGQLSPAMVWEQGNSTYMILGGHTRFLALKKLHDIFTEAKDDEQARRFEAMECNVYAHDEIDEIEARKIIIFDNIIRRDNTTAIKARAVINMAQLEKETRNKRKRNVRREKALEKIAKTFGISGGTAKGLYRLRTLIPEFWPLVDAPDRENRVTNQFARVIAGLDQGLQEYIYKKELYRTQLSATQMQILKTAASKEDIDYVYGMPYRHTVHASASIPGKLPKGYITLPIACAEEEVDAMKDIILWHVCEQWNISEETKNILRQLFGRA